MGLLSTGKWLAVLAAISLLGACSKSIDTVKNSPAPDASYKFGQLLDHKDNCTSTKWGTSEDNKGRTTVDYRCEVKLRSALLDEAAQNAVVSLSNDIHFRLTDGPFLPVLDGDRSVDLHLEAMHIPAGLADEQLREDPANAAKLDDLKARYDATVQQLAQVDAPCQAQLRQQLTDSLAHTRKYLEEHSIYTELIQWTLNDGAIVSVAADLTNAEGASMLQNASPNLLYTYMLAPTDRLSEEKLIVGNVPMPAQEKNDLNFCGRSDAYKPTIDALNQVRRDLAAVQASRWK